MTGARAVRWAQEAADGRAPVDLTLERQLEVLESALLCDPAGVARCLLGMGRTMAALGRALRGTWLERPVPGCGFELKVRAAEALGAWSVASGERRSSVVRRLAARRYEHRMWAARAVRASGWSDAPQLLRQLENDSFVDDNGFHLVREAAGFME